MMLRSLAEGFADQLADVDRRLVTERTRLQESSDREESALARQTIACLETLYTAIEATRNEALAAEFRATDVPAKFRNWRSLVLECRRHQDEMKRLKNPIEVAVAETIEAQNQVEIASDELSEHRRNLPTPNDFPMEAELAEYRERTGELEGELQAAIADRDGKKIVADDLRGKLAGVAAAFDRACFNERMSRLPDREIFKGVGELNRI